MLAAKRKVHVPLMSSRPDPRLVRLDDAWLTLPNPWRVPVDICAGPEVPIESSAIDELLTVLATDATLRSLGESAGVDARLDRVVCTPDLHKGSGIPIGTVIHTSGALIPAAVGNDINCGMRVEATSLSVDQVRPRLDHVESRLRHLFFEGGRHIGLTPARREGLLRHGLTGLLDGGVPTGSDGVWRHVGPHDTADGAGRVHAPTYPAAETSDFRDWITSGGTAGDDTTSYDSIIGSVGGGNHFAELQYVESIHDGQTAYAWGLFPGQIVLMVHSGSLSLGHQANATGQDQARAAWPTGMALPDNRILPMLLTEESAPRRERYLTALANAANFAVGNRFFLSLMLRAGLTDAVGELESRLVYDAPHNLLWPEPDGRVLHRKGATPAGGVSATGDAPTDPWGEPVIVPGSMGSASLLLRGHGNPRSLSSACHGAGRRVARGAASRGHDAQLDEFLREFRIVTPLNHRDPLVAGRSDIMAAWRRDLSQEAPWAYKDVGPVVESLRLADVATPVARLRPILTVKG